MKLLVDRSVLDARAPATRRAVEQWSKKQHSAALADEFNPAVIDMAKFDAFVAALTPETEAVLKGRPLALDARNLRIGASAPTAPSSFVAPLTLTVLAEYTDSVSARANATTLCGAARTRAGASRVLTRQAEQDVAAAQARGDSGTEARVRRWAVARVWEENAEAAAACAPDDGTLAADRDAARSAADAAVMLGGSMG